MFFLNNLSLDNPSLDNVSGFSGNTVSLFNISEENVNFKIIYVGAIDIFKNVSHLIPSKEKYVYHISEISSIEDKIRQRKGILSENKENKMWLYFFRIIYFLLEKTLLLDIKKMEKGTYDFNQNVKEKMFDISKELYLFDDGTMILIRK